MDSSSTPFRPKLRYLLAGMVLAILVLSMWGWYGLHLHDKFFPRRWGESYPGVFRSGQIDPRIIESTLASHNIKTIVCLKEAADDSRANVAEVNAASKLHIIRTCIPMYGNGYGSLDNYALAIETIEKSRLHGDPVLVHCGAGTHRTGGVLASYKVLVLGVDPQVCLNEMMQYNFNSDQNRVLVPFLNQQMKALAQELVKRGVISAVPAPLPQLPASAP